MQELQSFETSLLIDMLVVQMDKYTKMLSEGASEEEFARCSITIRAIQSEIESRKRTESHTSTTDSNIIVPE